MLKSQFARTREAFREALQQQAVSVRLCSRMNGILPPQITSDTLRVVLVASRNPLNIGAVARAMSNFGFSHLRVVNPFEPAFREARSAVGASDVLMEAEEHSSVAEAVADCTLVVGTTAIGHRELQHPVRRLGQGARIVRKHLGLQRVALLFGSEKFGLSNEDLSHCDWLMHVPTSKKNISMNLGQAAAVCLYEIARSPGTPVQSSKQARATSGELERITDILMDAMQASGYFERKPTTDARERVRRLLRRLNLPANDVPAWLSILRQIVWQLHNPPT